MENKTSLNNHMVDTEMGVYGQVIYLIHDEVSNIWYFERELKLGLWQTSTSYETRVNAMQAWPKWIIWFPLD